MLSKIANERGQGTVEAAVVIPSLFILLLMLLQPSIILYDRIVMGNAAAEGCRLLATKTSETGSMDEVCEAFIRHRLSSIPQQNNFHVHDSDCSWRIDMLGDEGSETVTVRIVNEVRPLPLFDSGARLLGATNKAGNLEIEESVTMAAQPSWVMATEGGWSPSSKVGAWVE